MRDLVSRREVVVAGGCCLAFGAAFANAGLVLKTGTSVSHLTGDIVNITVNLARVESAPLWAAGSVAMAALSFFLGAVLCGFLVHHPTLDISRPYGRSVTAIGALFLVSAWCVDSHVMAAIGLAAFGCGFQNSLASHYRGIILRTTHMTGMFTDFGVTLGMRLRGHAVAWWKIFVPLCLIVAYFLGALLSSWMFFHGGNPVQAAGLGYVLAGLGWSVWKRLPGEKEKLPGPGDGGMV